MKKKIELILEKSDSAKQKLDEYDEKYVKMKKLQTEKILKAKKANKEVQVDYVDLLVTSRSNNEERNSAQDTNTKLETPGDMKNKEYTSIEALLHGDNNKHLTNKRLVINNPTLNRMDSNTSHDNHEDSINYGDVNMTLGGYLNTYHSNAFKQHMQKIHNSNLNRSIFDNKKLFTSNSSMYKHHSQLNRNRNNSSSFDKNKLDRLYSFPNKLAENKPFSDRESRN